jgi:hypothetical protein
VPVNDVKRLAHKLPVPSSQLPVAGILFWGTGNWQLTTGNLPNHMPFP